MWFLLNIIQAILIALWSVFLIILVFIALLFRQRNIAFFIVEKLWSPFLLLIVGARIKSIGRNKVVNLKKPVIFVANHQSNYDIPAIINQTPKHLHFVAKKELEKVPFLGQYTKAMGMIFIDRKNKEKAKESLQKAGKLIKGGRNVILFPEGGRSNPDEIRLFKRGAFVLAQQTGVDIVPIAIKGTSIVQPKGGLKFRPGKITIQYGDLIHTEEFKNKTVEDFAEYTRNKVIELYQSI